MKCTWETCVLQERGRRRQGRQLLVQVRQAGIRYVKFVLEGEGKGSVLPFTEVKGFGPRTKEFCR